MTAPADTLFRIATAPLALPTGLRDLVPPRASERRALGRTLLAHYERYGYQLVIPPAFEREEVVGRGLSERARGDLVRFVEPESGEVVALRPDMTPQIARIAATHYRDTPGPLRLMYEGTVVRKPRGRSRRHRQIAQAGIECIGWSDPASDVEVIRATLGALDDAGLRECRVELGHAQVAELLLADVDASLRDVVTDALSARDTAMLSRLLGSAFIGDAPLARVLELAGGPDVLDRAVRVLPERTFAPALAALSSTIAGLARHGLADRVLVDLSEVRGLGYYTGIAFQLLAEGTGEPIGAGGRYDGLLARYGAPRPATGCALDLEHLERALAHAGVTAPASAGRALVGGADAAARSRVTDEIRANGASAAECSERDESALRVIAAAGGYCDVWIAEADGKRRV